MTEHTTYPNDISSNTYASVPMISSGYLQTINQPVKKVNIIFGATGQTGSYLAEHFINKGERVIGVARRVSLPNITNLEVVLSHPNFELRYADITDPFSLIKLFNDIIIDKNVEYCIFNMAAMSHVFVSFNQPGLVSQVTGVGHLNILEVLFSFYKLGFRVKTLFAASSEMFGSNVDLNGYQDLHLPFSPNSPYAVAKLYAYHMSRVYRESYGMFNVSAIMFNTESPRRGPDFVTRKITKYFAQFMVDNFKLKKKLVLGNVGAFRDWTHATDTVKGLDLIINNGRPKDYVIASGETHTIYNFLEKCYQYAEEIVGKKIPYKLDELFEISDAFKRPNEVKYLKGNATEIRNDLGWKPTISFSSLVREMLQSDYENTLAEYNLMLLPNFKDDWESSPFKINGLERYETQIKK